MQSYICILAGQITDIYKHELTLIQQIGRWNYLSISNFQLYTVEVFGMDKSFFPNFLMDEIT